MWGNPTYNSGGGVRYTPAIDTKTGTMYFGTGDPGPWPPICESPNALTRPGANLYMSSMVAMSLKNGALQWYNQIAPHDQFDYEFQIPPVLASANVSGQQQDIVIGAGKMGKVVAFNRRTGNILWETFVGKHQNDQAAEIPADGSTLTMLPGALGGVDSPLAYADGVVYVPVINLAGDYTTSGYTSHPISEGSGELVAIEVDTGKILWDKTFKSIDIGGAHSSRPKPLTQQITRLFLSDRGLPLTRSGIQQLLRRYGKRAGITSTRVSPHTFRHTFAKEPWKRPVAS